MTAALHRAPHRFSGIDYSDKLDVTVWFKDDFMCVQELQSSVDEFVIKLFSNFLD